MEKKQINSVSAKQAIANAKANATVILSAKDILQKVRKENAGILKSQLGTKVEIYKKEIFEGMSEKEIKGMRKKFRNMAYSFLSTIARGDKKAIAGFLDFYQLVYKSNDFSFSSIASDNLKEEKKSILIKGLEIVKKSVQR